METDVDWDLDGDSDTLKVSDELAVCVMDAHKVFVCRLLEKVHERISVLVRVPRCETVMDEETDDDGVDVEDPECSEADD